MKEKKTLYHFLDPDFGYEFVKYFYEKGLSKDLNIVLVCSLKSLKRNRSVWNPLRIYDFLQILMFKAAIRKKYRPFAYPIIFSANVNESLLRTNLLKESIGICTGFNQIFKPELINELTDFVNIHPSLLPFYRGPTPIEWCIANEEKFTGWTLHEMNRKIDTGKILFQEVIELESKTADQLKSELANQAKVVLYQYVKAKTDGSDFSIKRVAADQYYSKKVDYMSFYNKTTD